MAKKTKKIRMPKKEMKNWLKVRTSWNHGEWIELLDMLREKGFSAWTDNADDQVTLGEYLEENRKK